MQLRDEIVAFVDYWRHRSGIALSRLLAWIGLPRNRYYDWRRRRGRPNLHNAPVPKSHWILPWERQAILDYATVHLEAGYRRLAWLMIDEDIVAVSPSTVWRVLTEAGLMKRWNAAASA